MIVNGWFQRIMNLLNLDFNMRESGYYPPGAEFDPKYLHN